MARFTAPDPAPALTLSTGPAHIIDGVLTIHQPTTADVAALHAAGFVLVTTGAYFALPAEEPDNEPAPGARP